MNGSTEWALLLLTGLEGLHVQDCIVSLSEVLNSSLHYKYHCCIQMFYIRKKVISNDRTKMCNVCFSVLHYYLKCATLLQTSDYRVREFQYAAKLFFQGFT